MSFEQRPEETLAVKLLKPLADGRPVVLSVRDDRLPKRKRVEGNPLLFLTPASCFGGSSRTLMIALQTHGCELVDIDNLKSIAINRLGLSITLCKQLIDALNLVFRKGKDDGN